MVRDLVYRRRQRRFLQFFIRALNQVTSYESVADLLTTQVASFWDGLPVALLLPTGDGALRLSAQAHFDVDLGSDVAIPGNGLLAWVLKQVRQPISGEALGGRLEGHALLPAERAWLERHEELLWVPFVFHAHLEGLLLVQPRASSRRLETFFQEIVPQCAAVLSNLRLIQSLRRQVALLEQNQVALDLAYRQILTAREDERRRLARELHDSPLQEILHCRAQLQRLRHGRGEDPAALVEQTARQLGEVAGLLRTICSDLYPHGIDTVGLPAAMHAYVERHPALEERLELEIDDAAYHLPPDTGVHLFRIFQEAVNNAHRHAGATRIEVRLHTVGGECVLEIQDDGTGFDVPASLHHLALEGHFGLIGMWERAQAVGGTFLISSKKGAGTRIRVSVPLVGQDHGTTPHPARR